MVTKTKIEAVARCGCCFDSPQHCQIHNEPYVSYGNTHNKKLRHNSVGLDLFRSSLTPFLSLHIFSDNVIVENPTKSQLRILKRNVRNLIVIGTGKNRIGSIPFYSTHKQIDYDSLEQFMMIHGRAGYSWFNLSYGSFYQYAMDIIHTPYLPVYRIFKSQSYRDTMLDIKNCK